MKSKFPLIMLALLFGLGAGTSSLADKALAKYQEELLELAFEAAAAMPLFPHAKDRARAQEAVVNACLQLDQPRRALDYIEKIDNWRRGLGYAELAFYCAQNGFAEQAPPYLELANQIAEDLLKNPQEQIWRRDRIRAAIAKTYFSLGEKEKADEFETGLLDSELKAVLAVKAAAVEADALDKQVKIVDAGVVKGSFEQINNALQIYAQWFERFYDMQEKRTSLEEKIKSSWRKLPLTVRIELLGDLAGFALQHNDQAKALMLIAEAETILQSTQWTPDTYIPMTASLAKLRLQAGDKEHARDQLDAAFVKYHEERDQIVNIYRAGVLRPLAATYQAMGDSSAALSVYQLALEEGIENPNSRPRAEDLSATCLSMVLNQVEPPADLKTRIHQIYKELGPPW